MFLAIAKQRNQIFALGPGALDITGIEPRNPVALAQAVELRAGPFVEWSESLYIDHCSIAFPFRARSSYQAPVITQHVITHVIVVAV